MAKKYTRKDLKKPDEFISLSASAWEWVTDHLSRVLIMIGVAIALIAIVWVWGYFAETKRQQATEELTKGFELLERPIASSENNTNPLKGLPEANLPKFKTLDEKLKTAEKTYSDTFEKYSGPLKPLTALIRGNLRLKQGRYKEAVTDFELFLKDPPPGPFKVLALEGIGYCYEAQKDWDKAIEAFKQLPQEGSQRYYSLFHQARILVQKKAYQEANKLLKEITEKSNIKELTEQAGAYLVTIKGQ